MQLFATKRNALNCNTPIANKISSHGLPDEKQVCIAYPKKIACIRYLCRQAMIKNNTVDIPSRNKTPLTTTTQSNTHVFNFTPKANNVGKAKNYYRMSLSFRSPNTRSPVSVTNQTHVYTPPRLERH